MEQYEKIYLYQRIVWAKLFIDNNYFDNLDLNNISDQANFSKYHFIRLFKSVYGKTPNNYLIKVRMDNAKTLLAKGHSVLEASMLVGFDSPTSFAGAFKKNIGLAPSEYRREQEMKRNAIKVNPLLYVPNCFAETHGWTK
jgi:AraC-like DNA-binding protein